MPGDKPTPERELLKAEQAEMRMRWRKPISESKRQKARRHKAGEIMDELAEEIEKQKAKKPRGGSRIGAGRKPNYFKKLSIKPISAHELLQALDIPKIIGDLINDRNPQIRLATLTMLLNRAYGLPKESGELQISGGTTDASSIRIEFVHANGGEPVPRPDPRLLEGAIVVSPETGVTPPLAPVAEQSSPTPPPEPVGTCRFHGDFRLAESGGREICPQCRKDADRHERWLAGLMPGGGLQ